MTLPPPQDPWADPAEPPPPPSPARPTTPVARRWTWPAATLGVAATLIAGLGAVALLAPGEDEPGPAAASAPVVASAPAPAGTTGATAATTAPTGPAATSARATTGAADPYADCAGAGQIRPGQAGYREDLDHDEDGIACEADDRAADEDATEDHSDPDPRFSTCAEAKAEGFGPYTGGVDPEYDWYQDRDDDGEVCE
ncbi:excalibur calcium-binding domain-containing protein [Actinoplanes siamensis]|uniref:Excalibur calcium-binding domain-containing protein n=1 Tax=Actinoplanes siamensis TaxID=1223317 RepID=A0A919NDH6_9ACTN|nr:excalibur calcium-binding domain-containing protein [Actinoplanes siamensis]GIF09229.1 hypothetical protein Asi03nite_67670 [Actinoplanes siamensis]